MGMKYTQGLASEQEIYSHLMKCNESFITNLAKRVNLEEYSKKIFEKAVTFEAWSGNALVGLVAAYFNDPDGQVGYITNVSTIRTYMGKGIASELMNMCIQYAKQYNVEEIKLEVHKGNRPAINLYKRSGFMNFTNKDDFMLMKLGVSKL